MPEKLPLADLANSPIEELIYDFIRIDESEDQITLALLLAAAKEYLEGAGISEEAKGDSALYKLAVLLYMTAIYENRDPMSKGEKFNFSLESIILQLKVG